MFRKKRRAVVEQSNLMILGNRFVVAPSWAESADVLRESPELLTDRRRGHGRHHRALPLGG